MSLVIVVLLMLALASMPLFLVFGALTILGYSASDTEISTLIIEMTGVAQAPMLVAIPLFTFTGYVMAEAKTPLRLVRFARALIGWAPGGVAFAAVAACALFTAFTGASGVTIIALGGLLFPMLAREGLSERFTLGLLTTCGSLGLLFPPSLPVILYAIVAGIDSDSLFEAALLPGILLVVGVAAFAAFQKSQNSAAQRPRFSSSELASAFWEAKWELPMPVLIVAGIYRGWFTVNEAAALSVGLVLLVECAIYRDIHLVRDVPSIVRKSMVLVGAILLVLGVAMGLTNYLILEQVPDRILAFIQTHVRSQVAFLISVNIFLLIVGCLLDVFSAIIVVVPLLLPLVAAYGIDPLHFGVVFLTNLEIGYLTPPVGMNLFLSAFRFQKKLTAIYAATLPFIFVLLALLAVITFVPELSTLPVGR